MSQWNKRSSKFLWYNTFSLILQLDLTFTTLGLGLTPDVCLFYSCLKFRAPIFHPIIGTIEARTLKMVIFIHVLAQKCIWPTNDDDIEKQRYAIWPLLLMCASKYQKCSKVCNNMMFLSHQHLRSHKFVGRPSGGQSQREAFCLQEKQKCVSFWGDSV